MIAGKVPRRYFENAGMVSVHGGRWSNESEKIRKLKWLIQYRYIDWQGKRRNH